ncbi:MAG: Na/Pi cotransporter family protein [Candidatus Micrarchaeia archaeon]
MLFELIFILAGVAIFIYSIEQLSDQLLRVSKERLKEILQRFTDKPLKALGTGLIVTAVIQSSTATTSILVSLVNAGLISFEQSLGVIAGAHIGTTVTAQLVAFRFMGFAPIFILLGFLLSLFQRYNLLGKSIFLFGLVFFALSIISEATAPFKESQELKDLLVSLDNPLYSIIAGIVLTLILQSSSIVTALAVLLTMEGLIPVSISIPLVLGSNIGTTSTVLFVSKNMDIYAKRTAYAHFLFSTVGVILIYPFLTDFTYFVNSISLNEGSAVANAHTIFNVIMAVVFLFSLPVFIKLIEKLTPTTEKQILFTPKHIKRIPRDTDLAIEKIKLELVNHLQISKEMFTIATDMIANKDVSKLQTIEKYESLSDYLDSKITSALVELSQRNLTERQSSQIVLLSKISNEIERLADTAHDYAYITQKLNENNLEFSKDSIRDILKIKFALDEIYDFIEFNFNSINSSKLSKIIKMRKNVDKLISSSHKLRIKLLSDEKIGTYSTVLFIDAISSFEEAVSVLVRISKNLKM